MSVVNPASLSSEERPIGMSTRADLVIQESVYQGEKCWVVKDPLAMKYFRLMAPEHLVLSTMRQPCSYLDLKNRLDRAFPESITKLESLQQLVVSLHRSGLLKSESSGQAKPLRKRRNKELKQKAMQLLSSIISLRLPGFDPDRLLGFLYGRLSWMFSTWFTVVVWATVIAAGSLVLGNLDEFYAKLPDFQSFFAFDNVLFMGAILILTKTVHEFGHGLMCRHYGGECHEIGFMIMVMTPAMYCNTSDSWVLPNRWHRMAIGAAGMYVELMLAAICTFIWWFTIPGWLHYLALNIMFLSSVSTLLFNANPLLRYDGYYILSDFLEIPNLAQKSKLALTSTLRVWCLGMKPVNSRLLPQRNIVAFATYSVASFVYRWMIMLFIFWFVMEIFEPWGLAALGYLMVTFSVFGMVVIPLYKMVKFFLYPGRLREVKRFNLVFTLACVLTLAALVCLVPFEQYVMGECRIRPRGAQMVYVQEPGTLVNLKVAAGDRVEEGQVLAVLENREFDLELAALHGEAAKLRLDLTGYELNRNLHLDSERLITETRTALQSVDEQISLKELQVAPLTLKANRDGIVVAPPNQVRQPSSGRDLQSWSGSPLSQENIGAFLAPNTVVCIVADPTDFEAIVVLDQMDIKLLRPKQPVKYCVEQFRDTMLSGEVSYVSQDELSLVPRELSQSNGGPIAVKPTAEGERPVLKLFEAFATIDPKQAKEQKVKLARGFFGSAKVHVGHATLGEMGVRYLRNLINFR